MSPDVFHVFAPAKINLFLHITGKRADGYHTLESLMVFAADIGDRLTFAPAELFSLQVGGSFAVELSASPADDNLVARAAQMLAAQYGQPLRGAITLQKNLPVASGIGGGSSDAAAALKGLVRLWRLPEEPSVLQALALRLGADVPACLHARAVAAEGIGDMLTPVETPALHLVLVNPGVATPTAAVFRQLESVHPPGGMKPIYTLEDIQACRNDLTSAAVSVTPEIGDVLAALAATPACRMQRLSGSGATCFGVYATAEAAAEAAQQLKARHATWWVAATSVK